MKIKKLGCARHRSFGGCHSTRAVNRYLVVEGWLLKPVVCAACGHKWTLAITPQDFKGIKSRKYIPGQACAKCGHHAVVIKRRAV